MKLNLKTKLNQYNITCVSDFVKFIFEILDPKTNPIYKNEQFRFDMTTFGDNATVNNKEMCFGCMAAVSIISICDIDIFEYTNNKNSFLNSSKSIVQNDPYILLLLQNAIDKLRTYNLEGMCISIRNMVKQGVWPNFDLNKLEKIKDDAYYNRLGVPEFRINIKQHLLDMYIDDRIEIIISKIKEKEKEIF